MSQQQTRPDLSFCHLIKVLHISNAFNKVGLTGEPESGRGIVQSTKYKVQRVYISF